VNYSKHVRYITSGRNRSQGGPGRPGESCVDASLVDRVCDITDREQCGDVFEGCCHVIHLAAQGSPGADFDEVLKSNIIATYNVLEAAKKANVKRVIFASTNHTQNGLFCVNGDPEVFDESKVGGKRMKTTDVAFPDSFYGASKLYGEDLGKLYSEVKGYFEFVSLRIGWILYDDPTEIRDTPYFQYLLSMFLSQRDCLGFFKASLEQPLEKKYNTFYVISNNTRRVFDLEDTIKTLGYKPLDNSEHFLR